MLQLCALNKLDTIIIISFLVIIQLHQQFVFALTPTLAYPSPRVCGVGFIIIIYRMTVSINICGDYLECVWRVGRVINGRVCGKGMRRDD